MSAATINSAAPESTTASLAAEVPKEPTTNGYVHNATISSAAPESSTTELAGQVAAYTPGADDIPGGFIETPAETPAAETSDPIVTEGEEAAQEFSVKHLPASDTATNPFTLAPGEPIPQNEFTSQDINKHVKLDEESYERADASNLGFGLGGAPVLPDVVTPAAQREAEGRGVLDIPVVTNNIIPESSLPITSSAAATAAPEVPEIVKESQEKADAEPEASAIPEAVEQKKEVEEELKVEVPVIKTVEERESEVPAVATATTVAGIMAAAGIASASGEPNDETTPAVVPEIVRESQKEAHVEPEASAVEAAVEAKKEYEQELQKEVHEVAPVTLNAAHIESTPTEPAVEVPEVVQKSQAAAGVTPEASGVSHIVEQKKEAEEELKTEVKQVETAFTEAVAPAPLPKDEPKEETVTKEETETTPSIPPTVPSKTENGFVSNGNATEAKSEKGEKEAEANGNGIKSPKKSLENGDDRELKRSKRKSILGSLKDLFHFGTGTKDKGKAKGEISP